MLSTYEIKDILIFICIFAIAIKGIVEFVDWVKVKVFHYVSEEQRQDNLAQTSLSQISEIAEQQKQTNQKLEEMDKSIKMLISSDRDDIKAYITSQYHHFVEDKQWVDDFSLECLEKRYGHYVEEGGNSFIGGMMEKLRNLPRTRPPQQ